MELGEKIKIDSIGCLLNFPTQCMTIHNETITSISIEMRYTSKKLLEIRNSNIQPNRFLFRTLKISMSSLWF